MGFFKGLSIDGLIADIEAKIAGLHVVAELHADAAAVQLAAENEAKRLREFAEAEYARAKAIAAKFEALVKV